MLLSVHQRRAGGTSSVQEPTYVAAEEVAHENNPQFKSPSLKKNKTLPSTPTHSVRPHGDHF